MSEDDMLKLELSIKQIRAMIHLITREQTLLTGYGDPGRYDLSDLAFFNVLEADLIRVLTINKRQED